ncbi:hypothetical protein [Coxiella burnetii]|uniref:Uncharacterized protein n=3 Tax=Coxiella burnetii TaxID=777 RepID=Q83EU0_COXBU|nr:hypothetical protein [Coxiella burnetii]NP_819264.1 hypothetical protein CBU_0220 [Coxiella burnetii RSA 493]AAO89778.1 hypothetical protein CBU_0220 [Coxiella burnetii RSA 493]ABS76821.1 hypothetical protein CBUD_1876 [Coxiella burnetii Dugway 5J108-111]ABX77779.1 hypothetical protein COXBURSA331_A0313 [Coxiella burnetii RSA 331]ACJ19058.1 hypothetical protein CbuG_1788 [Coxiella burnetii CbuG_Q212]ACJ19697.1 hypothetical protein CbuK_0410 [Coxiella burnetii CbuK_Q154]
MFYIITGLLLLLAIGFGFYLTLRMNKCIERPSDKNHIDG